MVFGVQKLLWPFGGGREGKGSCVEEQEDLPVFKSCDLNLNMCSPSCIQSADISQSYRVEKYPLNDNLSLNLLLLWLINPWRVISAPDEFRAVSPPEQSALTQCLQSEE